MDFAFEPSFLRNYVDIVVIAVTSTGTESSICTCMCVTVFETVSLNSGRKKQIDFIVSASQSSSGLLGSVKHRAVCVGFKAFFLYFNFSFYFFLKCSGKQSIK